MSPMDIDIDIDIDSQLVVEDTASNERESPSRDEIARLAYQFYDMRGREEGHDLEDWLKAERELTEEDREYREY